MRLADILAFAFPSRSLHFQFYETHPTHRSNTRRLFPLGIPIEAKHRHPRLVCPRGGEGPPALPSWITRPCHIPPNRTRRSTIYISWRKKSGGGKIQAFQIDVPQFGAPTLVVRARNRRKSTRLWPVSSPSFIPLEDWSRRVSLSLSISRLLKFIVSTRMIRGRSNPLVRTRFHYAKSKENYKRSGYNWTAYGRRMKKRLNLR